MKIIFFSEEKPNGRFSPINDLKSIANRRIGVISLYEGVNKLNKIASDPSQVILLNEALVANKQNLTKLQNYFKANTKTFSKNFNNDSSLWSKDKKRLIAVVVNRQAIQNIKNNLQGNKNKLIKNSEIDRIIFSDILALAKKTNLEYTDDFIIFTHLHELITLGLDDLGQEITHFYLKNTNHYRKHPKIKNCYIAKNVTIDPTSHLDTNTGPILINKDTSIGAFTYLAGPLWIGENSFISHHSYIRNSVLGATVKIGGEVSSSIIGDYTNKVHYGFLGNSLVGEWVNIGAGTTTSNLKNNYRSVSYLDFQGKKIDTKNLFMGAVIGDFSKTGINSSLAPGTIIGLSASVRGQVDENMPSFIIYNGTQNTKKKSVLYLKFTSLKETLSVVFQRRNFIPPTEFWQHLEHVHQNSIFKKQKTTYTKK